MPPSSAKLSAALHADRRVRRRIELHHAFLALLREKEPIDEPEDGEEDGRDRQRRQEHRLRRPEEVDALQESQEQRRIAERRQRAADVGHQEDEEHHHMRAVLPVVVGPKQRPYQDHGGARRAHHARQGGPRREKSDIHRRTAVQIAADVDSAGDGEQGQQQDDERQKLDEQRVNDLAQREVHAEACRERDHERQGPERGGLAEMVMPEARRRQRYQRDRQQNARERHHPYRRQCGAVEFGNPTRRADGRRRAGAEEPERGGSWDAMAGHASQRATPMRCPAACATARPAVRSAAVRAIRAAGSAAAPNRRPGETRPWRRCRPRARARSPIGTVFRRPRGSFRAGAATPSPREWPAPPPWRASGRSTRGRG